MSILGSWRNVNCSESLIFYPDGSFQLDGDSGKYVGHYIRGTVSNSLTMTATNTIMLFLFTVTSVSDTELVLSSSVEPGVVVKHERVEEDTQASDTSAGDPPTVEPSIVPTSSATAPAPSNQGEANTECWQKMGVFFGACLRAYFQQQQQYG